jgi:Luciferase-like monooxygenase
VAKQVATLDHLTEGRLIFGVGVGGEFPKEYEVCGVPLKERGARLSEAIRMMRKLWGGVPVSHNGGRYAAFEGVAMQPPPRQPGGPPIWCGGRSEGALRRTGRLGDGWLARRLSRTDMYWKTRRPSGTIESPQDTMRSGDRLLRRCSPSRINPANGRTNPVTARKSDVLPAPLLPISATISPARSDKDTPESAFTCP